MIKAVIFDFDGVIHNTLELAFNINKQLQPSLTLEGYKDFFNGNLYKHKNITPKKAKKFFELQDEEFKKLKIEKEIKEELLKIKNRFDLFIISSNKEETLKSYFENNDMIYVFKQILGMESHTSKTEKFKLLLNKHNLQKNNCVFITDTLGDILEANELNINTIAVDFGFHERERLEKGKPIKIISNFTKILSLVEDISEN